MVCSRMTSDIVLGHSLTFYFRSLSLNIEWFRPKKSVLLVAAGDKIETWFFIFIS